MMKPLSLSAIGARLGAMPRHGDASFSAVSIDSRTLQPGDLYVAIPGARFDGHDFLAQAQEQGAVAAILSREADTSLPHLQVADTRTALGQIAAINREAFGGKLLAITGSAGKTTVKEMAAAILRERHATLATAGNFNNDIGVPLTLLRIGPEHECAVLELGASSIGEIAYTAALARPDVAVITNAADAHIEGFGSLNNIVQAKGEILDALGSEGTAVINKDDLNAYKWIERAAGKRLCTFSLDAEVGADCYARNPQLLANGCYNFELVTPVGTVPISLKQMGRHNIANALAAAAATLSLGAELADIQAGLHSAVMAPRRLALVAGRHGARIIDDSYNANPESLRAAIDVLGVQPGTKILVLGDMAELGDEARRYHIESARYALAQGVDKLFCVGGLSGLMAAEFGAQGHAFADKTALVEALLPLLDQQVTLLVKGSRSARMEEVVQSLTAEEE